MSGSSDKPDYLRQFAQQQAANVPRRDPEMRYEYAPPYSPQRTDPDYQKNWQRQPEYDPPPDDTLLGPFMMARARQQFAAQGGAPEPTGILQGGGARIPQTRMYDVSPWNQTVTPSTAAPQLSKFQQLRQMEQKGNVPQDVEAMEQGMKFGPGPVRGELHLRPEYESLGVIRPFGPGEWINRSTPQGTMWSSEEAVSVPFANGKWARVPTLWMIHGTPMQVEPEMAAELAQQSGLNWKMFNTQSEAEQWGREREKRWQQVPIGRTDMQPALWSRPWPPQQRR